MGAQQNEKKNVLNELIELGKSKGQLTSKEIFDATGESDIEPEQMERFYDTLESSGIEIVETLEDIILDDEELNAAADDSENDGGDSSADTVRRISVWSSALQRNMSAEACSSSISFRRATSVL